MGFFGKIKGWLGQGPSIDWPLARPDCRLVPVLQPAGWDGASNGFARRLFGSRSLAEQDPWVSFARLADGEEFADDVVSREQPERVDGDVVPIDTLERRAISELDTYMRTQAGNFWVDKDDMVHIVEALVGASFVLHAPLMRDLQRELRAEMLIVAIPTQDELLAIGSLDTARLHDRVAKIHEKSGEKLSTALFHFRNGELEAIGEDVRDKDLVLYKRDGERVRFPQPR